MSRWTDLATWRGPTANQGGPMVEQRGLVVHIAEGGFEGTIAWQKNPSAQVSSHFVVALDGRIAQVVDTAVTAWTQQLGNGHWVSVENEGHTPSALTPAQVEANAQLLARGHREHGWPLQIATAPSGRGLGHHSMGAENGIQWGHADCPGPAIKAQKPAILARAIAIINGTQEDTMPLDGHGRTLATIAGYDRALERNSHNRLKALLALDASAVGISDCDERELGSTRWDLTEPNKLKAQLDRIEAAVTAVAAALAALSAPQPGVLTDADLLAVQSSAQAGARAGVDGATAVIHAAP